MSELTGEAYTPANKSQRHNKTISLCRIDPNYLLVFLKPLKYGMQNSKIFNIWGGGTAPSSHPTHAIDRNENILFHAMGNDRGVRRPVCSIHTGTEVQCPEDICRRCCKVQTVLCQERESSVVCHLIHPKCWPTNTLSN